MNTKAIGKPSKEHYQLMNEVLEYLPKTEEIKRKTYKKYKIISEGSREEKGYRKDRIRVK